MHSFVKTAAISALFLLAGCDAFAPPSIGIRMNQRMAFTSRPISRSSLSETQLRAGPEEGAVKDDEIERLKTMAARLRAEASALEAEKADELARVAEQAFRKFDTNQDGEISLAELKQGLEKTLKTELSEKRVKALMDAFDTSGDGALQLDEFVGVDKFRNQLEALAREEKQLAIEAQLEAKREAEEALLAEARMSLLNDAEPTTTDKLVSVLPYLFPLMDGLQFGRFLLEGGQDNPLVIIVALLFALYKSVPFSGFIAFFALNFLSSNFGINRLVRFNMQQAIFLDIALFFPGLLLSLFTLVLGPLGVQVPAAFTEVGTDAVFVTLLAVLGYCSISSLFGIEPDKLPLISKATSDRMPTIDTIDSFMRRDFEEDDKKNKKD
mmetsp:Transcript_18279/g.25756  ORF Transcript_18279/g.25756 Transcript_18279/m.25756 type:complete len:382 (-) Transcript_18279:95-1240(-)